MNTSKLKAKDLITTAVFAVVMILVFFVGSMTFGMVPVLYPFLVAFICVPGVIVWAYICALKYQNAMQSFSNAR